VKEFSVTSELSRANARTALVIAHPGHELMVHGWVKATKPIVFIFTDGSGHSNQSRLSSTTKVLEEAGARTGHIYGRLTDREAYSAIMHHEFAFFIQIARELSKAFVDERMDYVAGDALEGYNPMHDVCRLTVNAAVALARRANGSDVRNLQFSLVSPETAPHISSDSDGICLALDDAEFANKMAAANGYPELATEVEVAVNRTSVAALRFEYLRPVNSNGREQMSQLIPYYELYGGKQVAEGHYKTVLRYKEHIAPLADALNEYTNQPYSVVAR
jgi:hypothetical protein